MYYPQGFSFLEYAPQCFLCYGKQTYFVQKYLSIGIENIAEVEHITYQVEKSLNIDIQYNYSFEVKNELTIDINHSIEQVINNVVIYNLDIELENKLVIPYRYSNELLINLYTVESSYTPIESELQPLISEYLTSYKPSKEGLTIGLDTDIISVKPEIKELTIGLENIVEV